MLRRKFADPIAGSTIRSLVLNVTLPATIFLSTLDINTNLDLIFIPVFAIFVNFYLMLVGFILTNFTISSEEKAKARMLILLFPSLAPGLTVYPFVGEFLGRQSLALVALADIGNKIFILIGLYVLAVYWYSQSASVNKKTQNSLQLIAIVKLLISEPVNLAIILGLSLAVFSFSSIGLMVAARDAIQKFADCSTPLILLFVGISLKLKGFPIQNIFMILLARSGTALLFSAGAITLLDIASSRETVALAVTLPQSACSLWPLLHAIKINNREEMPEIEECTISNQKLFDTDFAIGLLAVSFPFSICVILALFSSGEFFFASPTHVGILGSVFLGAFGLLKLNSFFHSRA